MGHQLNPGRGGRRALLGLATGLLVTLGAQAAPAVRAAAAEAKPAAAAPRYDIALCCQLCPRAADPAAYAGSRYLDEFRTLQQGQGGWLFRSRVDLATQFPISDDSIAELGRLAGALRARGTELVILIQPPRGMMDVEYLSEAQRKSYDYKSARKNFTAALERIRRAGVSVVPIDQLMKEDKGYEYFFRRDHHWTPTGAEASARLTAATVKALPAFEAVPRMEFVTKPSSLLGKPGTFQKVATQICGGAYSMQYVTGYTTELADNASPDALLGPAPADDASGGGLLADAGGDSGGLLGDASADGGAPQVALIGTSNSDNKGGYNFGGYLKQHLGADVFNAALAGGSFDGSLLKYLPSKTFQQHPPRILVWEVPWQNWPGADVSSSKTPYSTFRQALPLVNDGCNGKPVVMQQTVALQAGSNELLFNGGGRPMELRGAQYLLDLQFDDPTVKDMHAVIWYFSGQREALKMHFNQYVDNGGRFVTEFRNNRSDYANATFMGATIEMEQPPVKPLQVTARVCETKDVRVVQAAAPAKKGGAHAAH